MYNRVGQACAALDAILGGSTSLHVRQGASLSPDTIPSFHDVGFGAFPPGTEPCSSLSRCGNLAGDSGISVFSLREQQQRLEEVMKEGKCEAVFSPWLPGSGRFFI